MPQDGNLKKINQRLHAKKRALERYGLSLATKDLKEMAGLIQAKPRRNAIRLAFPSQRIGIWKIFYKEIYIPVAYDSKSKTIASILPPRALDRYKKEYRHEKLGGNKEKTETKKRKGVEKLLTFSCPECGKLANSHSGLEVHCRNKHGSTQ